MAVHNYYGSDEDSRIQRARLTDWTWDGANVVELTGKVADLSGVNYFFRSTTTILPDRRQLQALR
jgi:hypothetical protein